MSNEDIDIPPITSLMVDDEPLDPRRPRPTPPWTAPFFELLRFIKVIDISWPIPNVDGQRFCFQPSHDLSKISRIFLSVSAPFIQDDIDLGRFPLLGPHSVSPAVTKLQEYADHVLQRIQVRISIRV